MSLNGQGGLSKEFGGRTWRFGACQFDEFSRELQVNGQTAALESKPIEILHQLLLHAGEVVTRDELLEAVWPGTNVVEGSLATAVSKLRKALGDNDQVVVLTVPRIGYRLGVPAESTLMAPRAVSSLNLQPGNPVPNRDQWRLIRRLDASESSEIWLAEQPKTHESRVFKFALDGVRLKALKREATIARFLKESLGDRPDFVRILEWNFDTAPFYLESEYGGTNLSEWAESQGGLPAISLDIRLGILLAVTKAVTAAHGVGVLHKDLKPANTLIEPAADPECGTDGLKAPRLPVSVMRANEKVRVADFGSASLMEPGRLSALGITNLGFTQTIGTDSLTGTLMYLAPEILAGHSPTASADVYSLGVLLYQLVVGDFRRPLSPGWEAEVPDALLREDIAEAACGDPEKRLESAAILVRRIETLDERRALRQERELTRERTLMAEARIARARTRRPWVIAALVALMAGLSGTLFLYRRASTERDRANHQTAVADSVSRFLVNDLLGRGNPYDSGSSRETLQDAIKQASPAIDRQLRNARDVAARLHAAIARALDNRTDYVDARVEYSLAATMFENAESPLSQDAIIVQLQRAAAEARSYEKGSLPRAKSIVADAERRIAKITRPEPEVLVWLANARGMIALIDNDIKPARDAFAEALDRASSLSTFDERSRLLFKQRLAFTYIRLGDGPKAEQLFGELIAAFSKTDGPDSPNVLRVRLNLAQAYMVGQKNKEAVEETTRIYPAYVARLGEDHELSMQVLTTRAQSEGSLGLWNDTIRDDMKIHAVAARKQGPESFFAIATLSDASLAQCRSGQLKEGDANARAAYDSSVKAFGPRAGLSGGVAHTLATCLIGLGRLDEASALLQTIDVEAVAQLAGSKNWSANVDLAKADIAYHRGDYDSARKHLAIAAPLLSDPGTEPYEKQLLTKLTVALK